MTLVTERKQAHGTVLFLGVFLALATTAVSLFMRLGIAVDLTCIGVGVVFFFSSRKVTSLLLGRSVFSTWTCDQGRLIIQELPEKGDRTTVANVAVEDIASVTPLGFNGIEVRAKEGGTWSIRFVVKDNLDLCIGYLDRNGVSIQKGSLGARLYSTVFFFLG